jgi:hypothetical protein
MSQQSLSKRYQQKVLKTSVYWKKHVNGRGGLIMGRKLGVKLAELDSGKKTFT